MMNKVIFQFDAEDLHHACWKVITQMQLVPSSERKILGETCQFDTKLKIVGPENTEEG